MILTTHALTGAVIGKSLDSPYLIIILSIVIHYAMDTLRHGEYLDRNSTIAETLWKVFLDLFIGISIIFSIFYFKEVDYRKALLILLGTFFSIFPDLLTFLYWKMGIKFLKNLFNFHAWIHKFPPLSPERNWTLKNATNDIVISIIAIALLLL